MRPCRSLCLILLPLGLMAAKPEPPKVVAVQTGRQYQDYYGTAVTRSAALLKAPDKTYRWGITNLKVQEMAVFGGTMVTDAKHARHFRATLYADPGIKAPLEFAFREKDRNGAVLASCTLNPGQTLPVDIDLNGVTRLFFATELKIQHDKATRIILGEPTFE